MRRGRFADLGRHCIGGDECTDTGRRRFRLTPGGTAAASAPNDPASFVVVEYPETIAGLKASEEKSSFVNYTLKVSFYRPGLFSGCFVYYTSKVRFYKVMQNTVFHRPLKVWTLRAETRQYLVLIQLLRGRTTPRWEETELLTSRHQTVVRRNTGAKRNDFGTLRISYQIDLLFPTTITSLSKMSRKREKNVNSSKNIFLSAICANTVRFVELWQVHQRD